jgi:aspartate dehydrogenase
MNTGKKELKVGIAGLGTIGCKVADALDEGIPGLRLVAVHTRTESSALEHMCHYKNRVALVSADELAELADVIVDCVPKQGFRSVVQPALMAGRTIVTVSGAALLANEDLIDLAEQHGGRLILASGALLGLDAIRAAAEGEIFSVTMITRKPPKSLLGAPHLVDHQIDISNLAEPLLVFKGTAYEGALGFPSNVNVAAAVGLAGVGARNTQLEIWADPGKTRNTHTIRVDADSARFEMTIENIPSESNPGTSKITALSVITALRGLVQSLKVGS